MKTVLDERGQALVETALSMSVFVLLLLGAAEFGSLGYTAIAVNNAAKAAAQYGTYSHSTATDRAGMLSAAQAESNLTGLTLLSPSGAPPSTATSANGYTCSCADTGSVVSCTGNSVTAPTCPGSFVEISILFQTQATFNSPVHIPGIPSSYTLTGTAVQKVLQ